MTNVLAYFCPHCHRVHYEEIRPFTAHRGGRFPATTVSRARMLARLLPFVAEVNGRAYVLDPWGRMLNWRGGAPRR